MITRWPCMSHSMITSPLPVLPGDMTPASAPRSALLLCLLLLLVGCSTGRQLQPPNLWSHPSRYRRWFAQERCAFVADPARAVEAALRGRIVAQDEAIQDIVSALREWEQDRLAGDHRPLVIALTGTTGVGKSETALTLAAALLEGGDGFFAEPEGLVRLDGTEFSALESLPAAISRVRGEVAQGLFECYGQSVVILDEAQKIDPLAVDAISPLLQRSHPHMLYYDGDEEGGPSGGSPSPVSGGGGRPTHLSSSHSVFIIIVDVGKPRVEGFLDDLHALGLGEEEEGEARHLATGLSVRLRSAIRSDLVRHFSAAGSQVGNLINVVVPFLPFGQGGVQMLLRRELGRFGAHRRAGAYDWVDWDVGAVAELLSDPAQFPFYSLSGLRRARLLRPGGGGSEDEDKDDELGENAGGSGSSSGLDGAASRLQPREIELDSSGNLVVGAEKLSQLGVGGVFGGDAVQGAVAEEEEEEREQGGMPVDRIDAERALLCRGSSSFSVPTSGGSQSGDGGAAGGGGHCACHVPADIVSGNGARGPLFADEGPMARLRRTVTAVLRSESASAPSAPGSGGPRHRSSSSSGGAVGTGTLQHQRGPAGTKLRVVTVGACDKGGFLVTQDGRRWGESGLQPPHPSAATVAAAGYWKAGHAAASFYNSAIPAAAAELTREAVKGAQDLWGKLVSGRMPPSVGQQYAAAAGWLQGGSSRTGGGGGGDRAAAASPPLNASFLLIEADCPPPSPGAPAMAVGSHAQIVISRCSRLAVSHALSLRNGTVLNLLPGELRLPRYHAGDGSATRILHSPSSSACSVDEVAGVNITWEQECHELYRGKLLP